MKVHIVLKRTDTMKYEKVRVYFKSPRLNHELEEFREHAEIIDTRTVEFVPDQWDIHGDVNNLFILYAEVPTDDGISDVEWHIPMREVSFVRVVS